MAHVNDIVERSPGSDSGFLVPEPLGSYSGNVSVVHMRDSGSDFCPWNDPIEISHLPGISRRLLHWIIPLQQIIPIRIPSPEHFNRVHLIVKKTIHKQHNTTTYSES